MAFQKNPPPLNFEGVFIAWRLAPGRDSWLLLDVCIGRARQAMRSRRDERLKEAHGVRNLGVACRASDLGKARRVSDLGKGRKASDLGKARRASEGEEASVHVG